MDDKKTHGTTYVTIKFWEIVFDSYTFEEIERLKKISDDKRWCDRLSGS